MNDALRLQFPALQRKHKGQPLIYLDGPAGTQVPRSVIDAMVGYYENSNANAHGAFITSQETDLLMETTRKHVATFLGAEGPHTISFGQNMTTLNFSLSHAIARVLQAGDEILITQLDHEANREPWLALREYGLVVREVKLGADGHLDYGDLQAKLSDRTRLVAMGYASNILGTINDVERVRRLTHQAGAWLLLDAVHYAPHFALDVQQTGCDFLLCSAYKFYGPHVGILYCRPGLLDRLQPDRLRTAYQHAPFSIETGTLNFAAIAGVNASIEFIASLGEGSGMRSRILSAMDRIHRHEIAMAANLYHGLKALPGVTIAGPSIDDEQRAPTLAVLVEGQRPERICQRLAERNIFAWSGHFYAIRATEVMGVLEKGGVTRMGISAYSNDQDIDTTLEVMREMLS